MFVAAVCVLFLVKLKWPRNKSTTPPHPRSFSILTQCRIEYSRHHPLRVLELTNSPSTLDPYKDKRRENWGRVTGQARTGEGVGRRTTLVTQISSCEQ